MGKSKVKAMAKLEDGGFVPKTATDLRIQMELKQRLLEQYRAEEKVWRARQKILDEECRRKKEEAEREYNKEYNNEVVLLV